ncbi:hypothetical protein RSAG8_00901, partial [Rhizoctonia solani AG-8 WAC10335]
MRTSRPRTLGSRNQSVKLGSYDLGGDLSCDCAVTLLYGGPNISGALADS